jgi:thioredoxin 1
MGASVLAYQEAARRHQVALETRLLTAEAAEKEALEQALEVCRRAPQESGAAFERGAAKSEKRSSSQRRRNEASEAYQKQNAGASSPGAPPKLATISNGQAYRSADYLYPGYVTVLDFYADWCGPCRQAGPLIEQTVGRYEKAVLRKVNIVSWDSDAWRQASQAYGATGIPLICVFDGEGKLLGQVTGGNVGAVESLIKSGTRKP